MADYDALTKDRTEIYRFSVRGADCWAIPGERSRNFWQEGGGERGVRGTKLRRHINFNFTPGSKQAEEYFKTSRSQILHIQCFLFVCLFFFLPSCCYQCLSLTGLIGWGKGSSSDPETHPLESLVPHSSFRKQDTLHNYSFCSLRRQEQKI